MSEREIGIKEIFQRINEEFSYLKHNYRLILGTGLLLSILGYLYAYTKKPEYLATSTFVLEDPGGSGGMAQYANIASVIGIDLGGGGGNGIFQGDNILELYKSKRMIQRTLLTMHDFNGKKQLLIERYIDFNRLKEKWADQRDLLNIDFKKDGDNASIRLKDSLITDIVGDISRNSLVVSKPDKKLSIINVTVKSKDELFAKAFNDHIVKNVNEFYIYTKTKRSMQNVEILQHQADSIRQALNSAISGVAASADVNPNPNPARQILRVPSQKKQIDAQANTAILTELVKNLEISKVSLRKETPLIQIIDEPVFPLQKIVAGKIKTTILFGMIGIFAVIFFMLMKRGYKQLMK